MTTVNDLTLANFSSLLEVAVALNLVFAVWDGLRNQALKQFQEKADELNLSLEANLGSDFKNGRCAKDFTDLREKYKSRLIRLSKIAKFFGVLVTLFLILLLSMIGYDQDIKITSLQADLIVFISTAISPIFLFFGYVVVLYFNKNLASECNRQIRTLEDLKNFSKAA